MGLSRKSLVYIYILLLFLASVIPIGNRSSEILMNNYTLEIRWDYLLHAIIYLPLPIIMFYGLKQTRKGAMIWIVFFSLALIPPYLKWLKCWFLTAILTSTTLWPMALG